jgi:hypothetical protein
MASADSSASSTASSPTSIPAGGSSKSGRIVEKYPLTDVSPKITIGEFDIGQSKSKDGKWDVQTKKNGFGIRLDVFYEKARIEELIMGVYNGNFDLNMMKDQNNPNAAPKPLESLKLGISNMLGGVPLGAAEQAMASLNQTFADCDVVVATLDNWLQTHLDELPELKEVAIRGKKVRREYSVAHWAAKRGAEKEKEKDGKKTGEVMSPIHQVSVKLRAFEERREEGKPKQDVHDWVVQTPISLDKQSLSGITRGALDLKLRNKRFFVMAQSWFGAFILRESGEMSIQLSADQIDMRTVQGGGQITKEEHKKRIDKAAEQLKAMGWDDPEATTSLPTSSTSVDADGGEGDAGDGAYDDDGDAAANGDGDDDPSVNKLTSTFDLLGIGSSAPAPSSSTGRPVPQSTRGRGGQRRPTRQ